MAHLPGKGWRKVETSSWLKTQKKGFQYEYPPCSMHKIGTEIYKSFAFMADLQMVGFPFNGQAKRKQTINCHKREVKHEYVTLFTIAVTRVPHRHRTQGLHSKTYTSAASREVLYLRLSNTQQQAQLKYSLRIQESLFSYVDLQSRTSVSHVDFLKASML